MAQRVGARSFDALLDVDLQDVYEQRKQAVLREYAFRSELDHADTVDKFAALVFDETAGLERWTAREWLEISNRFRLLSAPEYEIRSRCIKMGGPCAGWHASDARAWEHFGLDFRPPRWPPYRRGCLGRGGATDREVRVPSTARPQSHVSGGCRGTRQGAGRRTPMDGQRARDHGRRPHERCERSITGMRQ